MFEMAMFNTYFCRFMHKNYVLDGETCNIYTIWDMCPLSHWTKLMDLMQTCRICRPEWFPIIFWLVLLLGSIGSIMSFIELVRIYYCSGYDIQMWRDREFYILGHDCLRRARLIGSYVMVNVWLLLVYGVLTVSPMHIGPWLTVHTVMLGYELIIWLAKVMWGRLTLELHMIVSLIMPLLTHMLVRCVTNVFEDAIRNHVADSLHVF